MKDRILSVDVLRGMTVILMTIVNNPGDWGNVYPPLLHASWHGCTPTDLVFPFFLFVVGISTALAMPVKQISSKTYQKIATRTFRIICLGLFLNFFSKLDAFGLEGFPLIIYRLGFTALAVVAFLGDYDKKKQLYVAVGSFLLMMVLAFGGFEQFENVRIPGVLQRIGIVYGIVSLIYLHTSMKVQVVIGMSILFIYWGIMTLIPIPDGTPPNLEVATNLASWIDNELLGSHNWASAKVWDPEGILSTLPAIGTGIAGLLIGQLLIREIPQRKKSLQLLGIGVAAIILGLLWNIVFPINKALWTSSYVIYTAGLATLVLSILYYITDVRKYKNWTKPFIIFGVNPMVIFFFSGIIPRVLGMIEVPSPAGESISVRAYIYDYMIVPLFENPMNASLAGALIYLVIWFVILTLFYRKDLIFKV
jgi:predicted acyltransferase